MRKLNINSEFDAKGLFPPESLTWNINKEAAVLLGGLRALLMQIAHPAVGQGVADHSNFKEEPFGRLFRTLKIVMMIAFGDRNDAQQAAKFLGRIHKHVRGAMPASTDANEYDARDPDLQFWVFATLVESSIFMYDLLIRPLSPAECEQYYKENLRVADLLGIPDEVRPTSYADFDAYMKQMMNGAAITIGDTGRELAQDILYPNIRFMIKPMFEPSRILTVGMLPVVLRRKFGFNWGNGSERLFRLLLGGIRLFIRITPVALRTLPQARASRKRWAA